MISLKVDGFKLFQETLQPENLYRVIWKRMQTWVGNFCAVPCYWKDRYGNWTQSGIPSWRFISKTDIEWLATIQVKDGKTVFDKFRWLFDTGRGSMYYDAVKSGGVWQSAHWGLIAIGSFATSTKYNIRQVQEIITARLKLKGDDTAREHQMGRVKTFQRSDMSKPLDQLLREGLVDRCLTAGTTGETIFDTNQGIIYSPFWGIDFFGTIKTDEIYLPMSSLVKL